MRTTAGFPRPRMAPDGEPQLRPFPGRIRTSSGACAGEAGDADGGGEDGAARRSGGRRPAGAPAPAHDHRGDRGARPAGLRAPAGRGPSGRPHLRPRPPGHRQPERGTRPLQRSRRALPDPDGRRPGDRAPAARAAPGTARQGGGMSLAGVAQPNVKSPAARHGTPAASDRFTRGFTLLAVLLISGAYLDTWAHHNLQAVNREGFVTPWHALLYTTLLLIGAYLSTALYRNHRRGHAWREALPAGYGLSWVAMLAFALGGSLDAVWHYLFGIELSVAALVSPTHLLLMVAGGLIVSGPLRSATVSQARYAPWPAVVSATLILAMATF